MKYRSAPLRFAHKIFQKKKRKKRKPVVEVEGFKKASFLKKILPDTFYSIGDIIVKTEVIVKIYGWRFFSKPAGLELAFLNTRNLPLQSFFYFFIFLLIREISIEEKSKNGLEIEISSSERVLKFKAEKISASNQLKLLFTALNFNTLSYRLIFEDA